MRELLLQQSNLFYLWCQLLMMIRISQKISLLVLSSCGLGFSQISFAAGFGLAMTKVGTLQAMIEGEGCKFLQNETSEKKSITLNCSDPVSLNKLQQLHSNLEALSAQIDSALREEAPADVKASLQLKLEATRQLSDDFQTIIQPVSEKKAAIDSAIAELKSIGFDVWDTSYSYAKLHSKRKAGAFLKLTESFQKMLFTKQLKRIFSSDDEAKVKKAAGKLVDFAKTEVERLSNS